MPARRERRQIHPLPSAPPARRCCRDGRGRRRPAAAGRQRRRGPPSRGAAGGRRRDPAGRPRRAGQPWCSSPWRSWRCSRPSSCRSPGTRASRSSTATACRRSQGAHWLADHVKATAVGTVLAHRPRPRWCSRPCAGGPPGGGLSRRRSSSLAMVGLARLAPVLLLPLFYRFRPLDRPAARRRLLALAPRARTDVVGVFEWVAQRSHAQGQRGAGRPRPDAAHPAVRHVAGRLHRGRDRGRAGARAGTPRAPRSVARDRRCRSWSSLGGFFLADVVLRAAGGWLGYRGLPRSRGAFPLLMLTGGTWSFLMLPIANALSRAQERAADRYALETTRQPRRLRVGDEAAVAAEPGRGPAVDAWCRLLFYSHPPIRERIEAARAFTRT